MQSTTVRMVCDGLLAVLLTACPSDNTQQDIGTDGPVTDGGGLPDGFELQPCNSPGQPCNAHNACAIDPICGNDKLCRPSRLQSCDDGLPCTQDICKGAGLCDNVPIKGWCALSVKSGGGDAGPSKTEIKCFKDGDRNPADSCQVCRAAGTDATVAADPTHWSSANGGSCDDGNPCTKDDYCQSGVCKGTDYSKQCADNYSCTDDLCDGKGGCLGNKLRADYCLINGACYKDKTNDPVGSCNTCDVSKTQNAWTPITNTCLLEGKCYKPGDKHVLGCAECDPAVSSTSWTVKGSACLIDKVCYKPADKDTIACASCDPAQSKYAWTPLPGVCKIGGLCYQTGVKHPGGCAECDPAVSAVAWTVKGSNCLVSNVCKNPGDKDAINCSVCDPTKDKYDWSSIAGLCNISGTCFANGDKHPQGCAECDPAASNTSWTVKSTTSCLIDNVCRATGDKDSLGCGACNPNADKYDWSPLPGLCKIDGSCQSTGATNTGGCGVCDPTKSSTAWSVTGTGCLIDYKCVASGAASPGGCGTCDPSKSKTSWTVTSAGCLIGGMCTSLGTKETGGCGTCDPTKSTSAWTLPSGCVTAHLWSKGFGGTSSDTGYGVAVDANGNVYITGSFYGSIDLGGGTLTANGSSTDVFLASFTPSGQHRWSKAFGGSSTDYAYGIAVDGDGNVYITGYYYTSITFGGTTLTSNGSSSDIFLASFTPGGVHRWSKSFGGTSSDYGYSVATDSNGNVYLGGYFYSSIDFGGGALTSYGSNDGFLASFTSAGAHRWSKGFGGTSGDYVNAVATDASGNSYVTGYYYTSIAFGSTTLTSNGSYDVFLASYTPAGVLRWAKGFGGSSSDYGYGVATDASGNVYLTGNFYSSIDFGGAVLTANGSSSDIFLASLTSAGVHRWSKAFGGSSSDYGYGVATDPSGNVFITGYFYNSIDFGGGALAANGTSSDLFLASFTSSGAHRWSRAAGSTSSEYGRAVAADGNGNVYGTGSFYSAIDFGGGSITAVGSSDVYLVKIGTP
jgi:hypothetical protein